MSVDDGIAGIVSTVEELGLIDSTYFFVTSGEYRINHHQEAH
eukprot:COSAG02_NODE_40302_length_407_cov_0.675325_1_plen_41_part_01